MNLDDRMKFYEKNIPNVMVNLSPFVCRLDGRAFHTYTKSYKKPFDIDLSNRFRETTEYLLVETGAKVAYTQSDEISLLFHNDKIETEYFFGGKRDKLNSVLASMCTLKFAESGPGALFDCRTFQIPTYGELLNYYIWRYKDATRNFIQALSQHTFGHKAIQGKKNDELITMLNKKGVIIENEYASFQFGTTMIKTIDSVYYYSGGFNPHKPLYEQVESLFST